MQDQAILQCSLGLSRLGQIGSLHFVIIYFTCCQFNFQDIKKAALLCFCYRICLKCFTMCAGENFELQEQTLLSLPTSSLSLTAFFPSACPAQFTPSPSLFYKNVGPCTATARQGLWNLLQESSPLPSFSSFLYQTEQTTGESCADMPGIRLSKQARSNWNVQALCFPPCPHQEHCREGQHQGSTHSQPVAWDAGKGSPSKPAAQAGPPPGQGPAQPAQHQPHPPC